MLLEDLFRLEDPVRGYVEEPEFAWVPAQRVPYVFRATMLTISADAGLYKNANRGSGGNWKDVNPCILRRDPDNFAKRFDKTLYFSGR